MARSVKCWTPIDTRFSILSNWQDDMAEDYDRDIREINRQLDRIENRVSMGVQHFTDRTIPPGRG